MMLDTIQTTLGRYINIPDSGVGEGEVYKQSTLDQYGFETPERECRST